MCKFDCKDFVDKCHACCCGMIPFEKKLYNDNVDKIITKPIKVNEFHELDPFDNKEKDFIIPITNNMTCCFLQDDYKCAIYDERPTVCKVFGDETVPALSCHYQDKDGKKRSRQSKRQLERKSEKNLKAYLKKGKSIIKGENK